ncbi:hypothetical protein OI18_17465 [Flavihumibacter solisilvae]|uniref:DUF3857 domain-containing protein n=2 Tax=Flavihumibacter solisilvae TaxID=1349421 RepID=A0A0C1L0M4_9BACT|nr:hypothetical protein OI18_17465 [Flavihumibacter solisilvae]
MPNFLQAQSVQELALKFPGEEAVVLDHSIAYQLSVKDGQPYVESTESQKILYLSANAGAYMSKYSFYQSGFHELKGYEAFTKTADGKKFKVTDFKTANSLSSGVFYDDVKETSFDFPGIAYGSVGNLNLSRIHKDPHLLSPHYFTRFIPLVSGELTISFPKGMSVKYIIKGNDRDKVKFQHDSRRNETVYTFRVNDLKGERPYADAPDNSYYALHVVFYIEKYQDEKGQTISYLANTDDLYKLNQGFIKGINKEVSPELRSIVDSLTKNVVSLEERAKRIYKWVQDNIKYVAFEDGMEGFVPRDANLVCARRFGDCKDMSSILTVMLNAAKVPAYFTWIGTRDLPYHYTETPLPIVDNHMICTVRLNDRFLFLDGTDSHCAFGVPSAFTQGKEAMVAINENEYKILAVPVIEKEKNLIEDSTFVELTETGIKGNIKLKLSGYYSMDMHRQLVSYSGKDLEKYFKSRFYRGSNRFNLTNFEIGDRSDFNNITLTAQFDLQGYARKIDDEWFLNLNLFKHYEHEEIDFPKRQMPVAYTFLNKRKYITVLRIPEGYKVSAMPGGKSFRNDMWGFEIRYEQKNNQIILTQEFDNNHLLITPDKFQQWNRVLENLFPAYKETISLSKK